MFSNFKVVFRLSLRVLALVAISVSALVDFVLSLVVGVENLVDIVRGVTSFCLVIDAVC